RVDRYGEFRLTEAVRPSVNLQIVPRQGYRHGLFRDPQADLEIPLLAASVSAEQLFDVFLDLIEPLGEVVDVGQETSHESADHRHRDLMREQIDRTVLMSHLCDYEDLLLNDRCTGIAVIATERPMELQFDEHKLLVVYARNLRPFEDI